MRLSEFKEPFDKNDLLMVLVNGIIVGILGGICAGALDYLFSLINIPISFGLIIVIYLIIWRVRKSFYTYHIWYSVLAIVSLIIGLFFSYYAFYALYSVFVLGKNNIFLLLGSGSFWLGFLLDPVNLLINGIKNVDVLSILVGVLNLGIYIYAFYITFVGVRPRRR